MPSRGGGLYAVFSRLLREVHTEKATMELTLAGSGDLGKEALRQWEDGVQGSGAEACQTGHLQHSKEEERGQRRGRVLEGASVLGTCLLV